MIARKKILGICLFLIMISIPNAFCKIDINELKNKTRKYYDKSFNYLEKGLISMDNYIDKYNISNPKKMIIFFLIGMAIKFIFSFLFSNKTVDTYIYNTPDLGSSLYRIQNKLNNLGDILKNKNNNRKENKENDEEISSEIINKIDTINKDIDTNINNINNSLNDLNKLINDNQKQTVDKLNSIYESQSMIKDTIKENKENDAQ